MCMCSGINMMCIHRSQYFSVIPCHRYLHYVHVFWCQYHVYTQSMALLCDPMAQVFTLCSCSGVNIMCIHRSGYFSVIPCHRYLHSVPVFWYQYHVYTQSMALLCDLRSQVFTLCAFVLVLMLHVVSIMMI